jgi:hypothetical protein
MHETIQANTTPTPEVKKYGHLIISAHLKVLAGD